MGAGGSMSSGLRRGRTGDGAAPRARKPLSIWFAQALYVGLATFFTTWGIGDLSVHPVPSLIILTMATGLAGLTVAVERRRRWGYAVSCIVLGLLSVLTLGKLLGGDPAGPTASGNQDDEPAAVLIRLLFVGVSWRLAFGAASRRFFTTGRGREAKIGG